ncbi:RusA family crossover junction endodeoxyribonuclease [Nocardioides sp. 1609]|uniref:RusA family crossover junction endodeoxyribonuclease n=1 Tax=Nocardioides sp. 1609 TaxID=2508327 RepID=UPI0010701BF3|nr:RusA family crossover junction endodeoxyribonuclease [Nocardioides sp. 1609]
MSEQAAVEREVVGRPTGYAGGQNEQRWKKAVRDAFAGATLPGPSRVQLEVDFVLTTQQRGRLEPDLDNLIKSTLDALDGVLGRRPATGARVEADDVRVDRLIATKRHGGEGEATGARIRMSELPEVPA